MADLKLQARTAEPRYSGIYASIWSQFWTILRRVVAHLRSREKGAISLILQLWVYWGLRWHSSSSRLHVQRPLQTSMVAGTWLGQWGAHLYQNPQWRRNSHSTARKVTGTHAQAWTLMPRFLCKIQRNSRLLEESIHETCIISSLHLLIRSCW